MAEAAKVVRIVGNGEQRLRDAVESGMLSVEAERAYKQVLEDCNRLKRENHNLRMQLQVVLRSRKQDRECKIEAYLTLLEKSTDYQRARDWRLATSIGLMAVGGAIVAVSTFIAML